MSILIRGMEMPTEGYRQVFITADGEAIFFPSTPQNGELRFKAIPIPDHGRLIDVDSVLDGLAHNLGIRSLDYLTVEEKKIVSWFRNATTVIEAENPFYESLKAGLEQAINGDVRETIIEEEGEA